MAWLAVLLSAVPAGAQGKLDPGISDTEIKLGQTAPYSGPLSAYSTFGRASLAYFAMINEQGGVDGRKITLVTADDGFSPPKTVEQVRRLVEADGVFALHAPVGSATNLSVRKYLNDRKVPQLWLQSGVSKFNDPKNFPWSLSGLPNYDTEVHAFAKHILSVRPNGKVAILYQNDDFGKEYLAGLKEGLGARAKDMMVGEQSFEVTDPTVESQVIALRGSGADVLVIVATQKQTVQALRKAQDLGWKPLPLVAFPAASITRTYVPAGLDASTGAVSSAVAVDPSDPDMQSDPGVQAYVAWMDKYYPAGDKFDGLNVTAYYEGALMVEVLKRCGRAVSRKCVMDKAASLSDLSVPMLRPGITVGTTPANYNLFKKLQMLTFDGKHLVPTGPPIAAE
ncbi:MAG: ABC transporter substrate-binding protein [Reyranella sp.]|uniref:ABC transporter substrate-binding protein n=1 Tax=Reyranella sp. TaxID=1929291 RepID=UPI001AD02A0C|nr:ABC transporter substrate-binding protein [Reyranella sp.]MBN9086130.1 ABC transporter substrate-binding protein [Reyranella sp.]